MRKRSESRSKIIELIDDVIGEIQQPFNEDDRRHGWSEGNRDAAVEMLERERTRLLDPRPLSADDVRPSLARDFDAIGIDGGFLLDRIATIGNRLNRMVGRR